MMNSYHIKSVMVVASVCYRTSANATMALLVTLVESLVAWVALKMKQVHVVGMATVKTQIDVNAILATRQQSVSK